MIDIGSKFIHAEAMRRSLKTEYMIVQEKGDDPIAEITYSKKDKSYIFTGFQWGKITISDLECIIRFMRGLK